MATASVSIDLREIDAVKRLLANAALNDGDRGRLLDGVGNLAESQTKERFIAKESPEGDTWKALAKKTREHYIRIGKNPNSILMFKGRLLDSVTYNVEGGAWSVLVGATMEYAAVHQFGNKAGTIPARPYLGVSREDAGEIASLAAAFLAGGLG